MSLICENTKPCALEHLSVSYLTQAVIPVGNIPEDVMRRYVSLIATHKQVSPAIMNLPLCLQLVFQTRSQ